MQILFLQWYWSPALDLKTLEHRRHVSSCLPGGASAGVGGYLEQSCGCNLGKKLHWPHLYLRGRRDGGERYARGGQGGEVVRESGQARL